MPSILHTKQGGTGTDAVPSINQIPVADANGNYQPKDITTIVPIIWNRSGTDITPANTGDNLNLGTVKAGISGTNYFEVEAGGFPKLNGVVAYKDINIAGAILSKPASLAPGIDTFRSTGGVDTTIETYAFALNEKVHGGFELQHDYKEGTDLVFHVHWQGITAPAGGTDNVQWRLTYIVSRDGTTLAATTIDSPDVAITTQYGNYRNDFGAITGTNFKIGDQFMFTLTRVAAVSDDYAGDCLIQTAGIHYQVDTLGSRTIGTK